MKKNLQKLNILAHNLRKETFLEFIKKGEAHLGGSFSIIETIIILFEKILKINDKFILSKSHASFPFCIYLKKKGYNPKITTHLEIDIKNKIYCTTGSLGHGLPITVGMAKASKLLKKKNKFYVLISDGECQEGTTWESLLIASAHKLDNLVIIVDYNKIQALQKINDVLPLNNLRKKFQSFNLNTYEVKNGHSFTQLFNKFNNLVTNGMPHVVILNTIKGKGIKAFENDPAWHAKIIEGDLVEIGKKALGIEK